jgi:hypothetical protein
MTETARAQEINDLIEESVYGPGGELTGECANAWEVAKLIASLQIRVEALENELRAARTEARPAPFDEAENDRAPSSALVEGVAMAADCYPHENARAAIRAVAAWLRTGRLLHAAELLEQEVNRG